MTQDVPSADLMGPLRSAFQSSRCITSARVFTSTLSSASKPSVMRCSLAGEPHAPLSWKVALLTRTLQHLALTLVSHLREHAIAFSSCNQLSRHSDFSALVCAASRHVLSTMTARTNTPRGPPTRYPAYGANLLVSASSSFPRLPPHSPVAHSLTPMRFFATADTTKSPRMHVA